jgi:signal peptide peptidase SppA
MRYANILSAVYGNLWAMHPERFEAMCAFLEVKASGELPAIDVQATIHAAAEVQAARAKATNAASSGTVAILPLYGVIMQRGNMMGDISGPRGTSVEQFKGQFRQMVNDPNVKAIVIDVDSPGGTVAAVDELTSEMFSARSKGKRVIAVSNCLMASAAYFIASAANEIVASPSSQTGSIGVYAALRDDTGLLEKNGIKYTVVTHGENKALGDPRTPTTQAAIDQLQELVTAAGNAFDQAVARNRGISMKQVRDAFGQGKTFTAQQAKAIGMVDRVASFDDVLAELGIDPQALQQSRMKAEAERRDPQGETVAPVVEDAERERKAAHRSRELELAGV